MIQMFLDGSGSNVHQVLMKETWACWLLFWKQNHVVKPRRFSRWEVVGTQEHSDPLDLRIRTQLDLPGNPQTLIYQNKTL